MDPDGPDPFLIPRPKRKRTKGPQNTVPDGSGKSEDCDVQTNPKNGVDVEDTCDVLIVKPDSDKLAHPQPIPREKCPNVGKSGHDSLSNPCLLCAHHGCADITSYFSSSIDTYGFVAPKPPSGVIVHDIDSSNNVHASPQQVLTDDIILDGQLFAIFVHMNSQRNRAHSLGVALPVPSENVLKFMRRKKLTFDI